MVLHFGASHHDLLVVVPHDEGTHQPVVGFGDCVRGSVGKHQVQVFKLVATCDRRSNFSVGVQLLKGIVGLSDSEGVEEYFDVGVNCFSNVLLSHFLGQEFHAGCNLRGDVVSVSIVSLGDSLGRAEHKLVNSIFFDDCFEVSWDYLWGFVS